MTRQQSITLFFAVSLSVCMTAATCAEDEAQVNLFLPDSFSLSPFELWKGTELAPMEITAIDTLPMHESQVAPLIKRPPQTTDDLLINNSEAPAFADPIALPIWRMVSGTIVVLIIAGVATFFHRRKGMPDRLSFKTRRLRLVETLPIDAKTKVHLVACEGERYLIVQDMTGLKDPALIPNWNSQEMIESQSSIEETETEQAA